MAHDVFISHSSKDRQIAEALCHKLESSGIRCWMAPRDIWPGRKWTESIVQAIGESRLMVLIFSTNANTSDHIERELEIAARKRLPLLPFRVEDVEPSEALEYYLGTPHWLDAMTPPLEQHLNQLVKSVNRYLPSPPHEVPAQQTPHAAAAPVPETPTPMDDFPRTASVEEKIEAELRAIRARDVETAGRIREEAARRREEEREQERQEAEELKRKDSGASDENELVAGKEEWKWITDAVDGARRRHEALERKAAEELKRSAAAAQEDVEARERAAKETQRIRAAGNVPANMTNGMGVEFVWIPPGSFMMGSERSYGAEPVHRVTIREGFYMGKYEVTQAQWQHVMGNNPADLKGDNLPVESVSWNDAQEFIQKLNAMNDGFIYRLPSEAEWEYACRAGTTGDYAGDFDSMAWYGSNSQDQTHPVGQKYPNAFGLYDMHGNVSEWCEDYYHENYSGAPSDGSPRWSGAISSQRVMRGGSFVNACEACRSACRAGRSPDSHNSSFGFRIVASALS